MLPGISGLEACRRLRAAQVGTPILVLTARILESDETDALDMGADDYLRKPFSLDVLLARCRALTRRGSREGWANSSSATWHWTRYAGWLGAATRRSRSAAGRPRCSST